MKFKTCNKNSTENIFRGVIVIALIVFATPVPGFLFYKAQNTHPKEVNHEIQCKLIVPVYMVKNLFATIDPHCT